MGGAAWFRPYIKYYQKSVAVACPPGYATAFYSVAARFIAPSIVIYRAVHCDLSRRPLRFTAKKYFAVCQKNIIFARFLKIRKMVSYSLYSCNRMALSPRPHYVTWGGGNYLIVRHLEFSIYNFKATEAGAEMPVSAAFFVSRF